MLTEQQRNERRTQIINTLIVSALFGYLGMAMYSIYQIEQDIRNRLDMLQAASNTCTSENGGAPCSFELMLEKKLIPVHPHTYPGSKSYSISEGVVKFRKQLAPNVRPIKKSSQP